MSELVLLNVGGDYPLKRNAAEGLTANLLLKTGGHAQIVLDGISKEEEAVLRKGVIKAGILYDSGAMLIIFQFYKNNKPFFTFDAPFDIRILPPDVRDLPDINKPVDRLAFDIHIVDSQTNTIRGLRYITMSPDMTLFFLSSVQDQLASLQNGDAVHALWLQHDPAVLFGMSKKWTLGV
jgi:hypothetical protein